VAVATLIRAVDKNLKENGQSASMLMMLQSKIAQWTI